MCSKAFPANQAPQRQPECSPPLCKEPESSDRHNTAVRCEDGIWPVKSTELGVPSPH